MKVFRSRAIYSLLFLFVAISTTYQIVGSVSLMAGYFNVRHQSRAPFEIDSARPLVTSVTGPAKQAGLAVGDEIESIDGIPYTGRAVWQRIRWYAHRGDFARLAVRHTNGTRASVTIPLEGYSGGALEYEALNHAGFTEAVFGLIFLRTILPLICLLLGYWVALVRPQDLNAWLILILLCVPEAYASASFYNWWPEWLPLRLLWLSTLSILAPGALFWLGLRFPERSRIDCRFPWLKWLVTAILAAGIVIALVANYSSWYNLSLLRNRAEIDQMNNRVLNWVRVLCVVIYWVALCDNLLTTSTPDNRRRLRVLLAGSVVGLGSALIFFGALPLFGIADPYSIDWLAFVNAVLMLTFPLSLAYVVIVQRAMDVRILLRMGTKYALARRTLAVVRGLVIAGLAMLLVEEVRTPEFTAGAILRIIGCAVLLLAVRSGLSGRLSGWIDRKFFRETYHAEVVLSELAERIPTFIDPKRLIETVAGKLSEVLHVGQIAVLLRSGQVFELREAIGLSFNVPLQLPASSSTIQHLTRTSRPATLYREHPDQWLQAADDNERRVLDSINAEVLLGLPGRQRLMGLMALGPKRSEAPYSPSDLQVLQSIGVQTGLALEVSELAHSLAAEAAQRASINRELEIAREVQERLLPQQIPAVPGITLAGTCRPAQAVGGDYYDVIELGERRFGLAVGDVSGKGISAALLMASLRACLRTMTVIGQSDLAKLMERLNGLVYESSATNRYATFFFAIFDAATRELCYVNAGHNPPLVIRASTDESTGPVRLEAGGPVIGLLPNATYNEQSITFESGDLLLAYTDGISEAMNESDEEWGEERLIRAAQSVHGCCAEQVLTAIFTAAREFTGNTPQHDDMTLLVLKIDGVESGAATDPACSRTDPG
jgi:sigma-B regulation protein RsbU (phosphoserine phosphatase)